MTSRANQEFFINGNGFFQDLMSLHKLSPVLGKRLPSQLPSLRKLMCLWLIAKLLSWLQPESWLNRYRIFKLYLLLFTSDHILSLLSPSHS